MANPFSRKILCVLAVGLVLVYVAPAAAGILICVGDDPGPDCCEDPADSASRPGVAASSASGADCYCCITVNAASSKAEATAQKASKDVTAGLGLAQGNVSPEAVGAAHSTGDSPGNPRLPSIRTVVLLI